MCTVSGSTATTVKPGTCTITASQSGNADYAAAPDVQRSFQVNQAGKKSQTIAFAQPSPAAVGATVALSASATSGLPVSFTSSTPAMCTVSGSTATTVAPGTCMITASQGGDADYAAAPDVAQSFQVNPAGQKPQTITFAPPTGTKVGEPVALSASASSAATGVVRLQHPGRVHGGGLDRHPGGRWNMHGHRLPERRRQLRTGPRTWRSRSR